MSKIQFKRGKAINRPMAASAGEPIFAVDTGKLYVGNDGGVVLINPDCYTEEESDDRFAPVSGVNGIWKTGNMIHNVAHCLIKDTSTEILINTGIPWLNGSYMPVVYIHGYAYGAQSPIDLKICFYVLNNILGWCGAVSVGAWRPTIKLYSYTNANNVKSIGIALIGSMYFPQFTVDVQNEYGSDYADGWTIQYNASTSSSIVPVSDLITVPYRATCSNALTLTGDVSGTVMLNGADDAAMSVSVADDSHNHSFSTVTGLQSALDAKAHALINANEFPGMALNDGTDQNWVRTTSQGLIPYKAGGASTLGTSTWPFSAVYANTVYENGAKLSDTYLTKGGTPHINGPFFCDNGSMYVTRNNSGGWAQGVSYFNPDGTLFGMCGFYGSGDTVQNLLMGSGTSPWLNPEFYIVPNSKVDTHVPLYSQGFPVCTQKTVSSMTDFDQMRNQGLFYIIGKQNMSAPTSGSGTLMVTTTGTTRQVWIDDATDGIYSRRYSNSAWTSWVKIGDDLSNYASVSSGNWTPTIACAASYSVREGFYYRIGRKVTVCCRLSFAMQSGYAFTITGLPFAAGCGATTIPSVLSSDPGFGSAMMHLKIDRGSSTVSLMQDNNSGSGYNTWVTDSHDDCQNRTANCTLEFTLEYIA